MDRHQVGYCFLMLAFGFLVLNAGCMRKCVPGSITKTSDLVDVCPRVEGHAPVRADLLRTVAQEFQRRGAVDHPPGARPYHFLALSGGGVYGAFGAGVLNGWTSTGTRPEFDVVTGISTGSLISTFAFLGPQYDAFLAKFAIENSNQRDLIRRLPLGFIPFFDSLYTSRPLRLQIEQALTPEVIREVATAHANGRRLYVGTTNLDSRKLVIWDMGEIAIRGTPEAFDLYRKIILASSSVPLVFPAVRLPVEINGHRYEEMHVDGGVSDEVIFRAFMVSDLNRARGVPDSWAPPGSTLYVVTNGKLYADSSCVRSNIYSIFSASMSTLIYGKGRDEFYRIFVNCLETGVDFRLTSVPQSLSVSTNALRLNREDRQKLLAAGWAAGSTTSFGPDWRTVPPGSDASEQALPRSGTRFMTRPKSINSDEGEAVIPLVP